MPPVALTVALPVFAPKQLTFVCALMLLLRPDTGCVIVDGVVVEHPLISVMVHVQVPAARLIAVAVDCTGMVFHE